MISQPKRKRPQVVFGVLSAFLAASLAVLLGWLAVQFTVRLTDTFEVIATIVGWILWPFWI